MKIKLPSHASDELDTKGRLNKVLINSQLSVCSQKREKTHECRIIIKSVFGRAVKWEPKKNLLLSGIKSWCLQGVLTPGPVSSVCCQEQVAGNVHCVCPLSPRNLGAFCHPLFHRRHSTCPATSFQNLFVLIDLTLSLPRYIPGKWKTSCMCF